MKRTLFLCPHAPWPTDVGFKIRVFNLLRSYAELGPVTLVCFADPKGDAADFMTALRPFTESIHCLPLASQTIAVGTGKLAALRHALQLLPRIVRVFTDQSASTRVAELLESERYDFLHVERLFMSRNVVPFLHHRSSGWQFTRIIDLDDLESAKMQRQVTLESWRSPRKLVALLEYLKIRWYERRTLPLFDRVLVCSAKDRSAVRARNALRVEIFPNGATLSESALTATDDSRTLLFLGVMEYAPNEDAALYFVREILPLVRQQIADVRFIIAGRNPSAAVRALHDDEHVVVAGYVPDLQQLFASATLVVVPIRSGGGTRIKILEAMAAGRPVVSTTVGCEGIDATPGQDILLGDCAPAFAAACVELLSNGSRRQLVGDAGRQLVSKHYQWQQIRRDFVKSLTLEV